jgi:hypothetical protein
MWLTMKIVVVLDLTPCSLVDLTEVSEKLLYSENGGNTFFRNFRNDLRDHTMPHSRRQWFF